MAEIRTKYYLTFKPYFASKDKQRKTELGAMNGL